MEFDEACCSRCGNIFKMEEMENIDGDFYCDKCIIMYRDMIKVLEKEEKEEKEEKDGDIDGNGRFYTSDDIMDGFEPTLFDDNW